MLDKNLSNKVLAFIEHCEQFKGYNLAISEAISTQANSFDRHCTTFSNSEFIVQQVITRLSGARIMFLGKQLTYEIALDLISDFEQTTDNTYLMIEVYNKTVYRKSILTFHP